MEKIFLASNSPRRKEILESLGVYFSVIKQDFDESIIEDADPIELCRKIARGKCERTIDKFKENSKNNEREGIILAADTMVFCKGRLFGKSRSIEDARNMLSILSNSEHSVVTALCCFNLKTSIKIEKQCLSKVFLKKMSDSEIDWYLSTNEWQGVAGAYRIQERGALFIKKIEGSYSNIVGLPIFELYEILTQFGFKF